MNLSLDCQDVKISPSNKQVYVELEDVDKSDVLNHFDIAEVVYHFGETDILDYIDIETVKKYYGLVEEA